MKSISPGMLLLLIALSGADAKPRHCLFRAHTEANPKDSSVFSTSVRALFSGKEVAIEKAARITESDVIAFYPYPVGKDSYGVLFQLDEHGKVALEALSIERRGSLLFIFINGRPITELQIDKRISDGQIYIATGLTRRDIDSMKKDWPLIGKKKR